MEGTHGELSSRFADGLRSDDPNSEALFREAPRREIEPIALRTDADSRFTGHSRADANLVNLALLKLVRGLRGYDLVLPDDHLIGYGVHNAGKRDSPKD